MKEICTSDRPDMVIVVGNVNSTLACSIVAKKMQIQVAHVEAGLRSFDLSMPEEINRTMTDAISDLFFVTEEQGMDFPHSSENPKEYGIVRDQAGRQYSSGGAPFLYGVSQSLERCQSRLDRFRRTPEGDHCLGDSLSYHNGRNQRAGGDIS